VAEAVVSARHVLALAALLAAAPAAAADDLRESPRWGSFDLMLSGYHPKIDQEFGGQVTPYQTAFGSARGLMFRFDVAKSLFTEFGSLEAGIGAGYFERYGKGVVSTTGLRAGDNTAFKVLPLRASLTYRFDYLAREYNIPLVPYGRASLDRYQWWVLNGAGDTASANGAGGSGATNGYSFSGGMAILLDFLDQGVARDMDRDVGINDTYLFVDFSKSFINDFGASRSWNLSDDRVTVSGGIMFVF
jgi:hypothetical protein